MHVLAYRAGQTNPLQLDSPLASKYHFAFKIRVANDYRICSARRDVGFYTLFCCESILILTIIAVFSSSLLSPPQREIKLFLAFNALNHAK